MAEQTCSTALKIILRQTQTAHFLGELKIMTLTKHVKIRIPWMCTKKFRVTIEILVNRKYMIGLAAITTALTM